MFDSVSETTDDRRPTSTGRCVSRWSPSGRFLHSHLIRIQNIVVGPVADGMGDHGQAMLERLDGKLGQGLAVVDVDAVIVGLAFIARNHRGAFGAERTIDKDLDPADAQPGITKTAAQTSANDLVECLHRQHLDHSQGAALLFTQTLISAKCLDAAVAIHAMHASQALLVHRTHGQQRRVLGFLWRGAGHMLADQAHCIFEKQPGGIALCIAHDLATLWVGRVFGHIGQPHGRAVGPAAVPAARIEEDRVGGRCGIEMSCCG